MIKQSHFYSVADVNKGVLKEIEVVQKRKELLTGIPTGFTGLDKLTAGLQVSELTVLAGHSLMGKTSLMLCISYHAASFENIGVAIFSLDLSKEQLGQRWLTLVSRVGSQKIRTASFNSDEQERIGRASYILERMPVYINDTPAISLKELRVQLRKITEEADVELVFIDYWQLMRGSRWTENREQELKEIVSGLRSLAIEYDIHIVALSQLPVAIERDEDKRPRITDFPEYCLGYVDNVMLLYRGALYQKKKRTARSETVELNVAKQKNGACDTVELRFIPEIMSFENPEFYGLEK